MYIGSTSYSKVYAGSSQIQTIYQGTTKVYSNFEPETLSLFSRMTVQPSTSLKILINTTIKGLKDDGIWDLADCLYIRGVHTPQAACLNWIKDAHNSTLVNNPGFIAKVGFQGVSFGAANSRYINNNFKPYSQRVNFQHNSCTIAHMHTKYRAGVYALGGNSALNWIRILWNAAANDTAYLNSTNGNGNNNYTDGDIVSFTRGGNYLQAYKNGSAIGVNAVSAIGTDDIDQNMYELNINANGSLAGNTDHTISFSFYGGYLDATKSLALYNRIRYYYDNVLLDTGLDEDAQALIYRMSVEPTQALKDLISTTITSLKGSGVWSKLDCLYMFNTHDSQAASLSWVNPTYDATLVNSPTFTPKVGIKGNGSSSYIKLNYNPGYNYTVTQEKYTMYDCCHGFLASTLPTINGRSLYGVRRSTNYMYLTWFSAAGEGMAINQTNANALDIGNISSNTLYTFCRISSSGGNWYYNGGNKTTFSKVAVNYVPYADPYPIVALAFNDYGTLSGYSDAELSNLYFGSALTDAEVASLYSALSYFNTNVSSTF